MESSHQQTLPEQFSVTTLEKNLAALSSINEHLFQRICLPVDGSHVHFLNGGEVRYERHRALFPFVINKEDIMSTLDDINDAKNILLFGIGLGEQLYYMCRNLSRPDSRMLSILSLLLILKKGRHQNFRQRNTTNMAHLCPLLDRA